MREALDLLEVLLADQAEDDGHDDQQQRDDAESGPHREPDGDDPGEGHEQEHETEEGEHSRGGEQPAAACRCLRRLAHLGLDELDLAAHEGGEVFGDAGHHCAQ